MFSESDDYQPFGYMGRVPLYFTTLLVIAYTVSLVVLVVLKAASTDFISPLLPYGSFAVLHGFQFWRFATWSLKNDPDIWFLVNMVCLYWFGREVERFIGRRAFMVFYLTMALSAPCVFTALGTWFDIPAYYGAGGLSFGVFIGFVAIYANVEIFWSIKAKWIALALGGITVLQCLAFHLWGELIGFCVICATAWLFIKRLRGQISFPRLPGRDFFRRRRSRRSLRVVPGPGRPPAPRKNAGGGQEDLIESIDPLLDKIAKSGLASLTEREREKLERARAELLKKSGK